MFSFADKLAIVSRFLWNVVQWVVCGIMGMTIFTVFVLLPLAWVVWAGVWIYHDVGNVLPWPTHWPEKH
jgi:chromate transport protein ChrA